MNIDTSQWFPLCEVRGAVPVMIYCVPRIFSVNSGEFPYIGVAGERVMMVFKTTELAQHLNNAAKSGIDIEFFTDDGEQAVIVQSIRKGLLGV